MNLGKIGVIGIVMLFGLIVFLAGPSTAIIIGHLLSMICGIMFTILWIGAK